MLIGSNWDEVVEATVPSHTRYKAERKYRLISAEGTYTSMLAAPVDGMPFRLGFDSQRLISDR